MNSEFPPSSINLSLLSPPLSPSILILLDFVKQRHGQITRTSQGKYCLEISLNPLYPFSRWILQETDQQKWLLIIDGLPQFFLSTEAVLKLLKEVAQATHETP